MSRLNRMAPCVAFLALATACASDPLLSPEPAPVVSSADVRVAPGMPFRLAPGEFALVPELGLLIGFRGIQADSRCPVDAACVWQGDAEAVVGTAPADEPWNWSVLHTGVEPREIGVDGGVVTLVDVEPALVSNTRPGADEYRAVLRIDTD